MSETTTKNSLAKIVFYKMGLPLSLSENIIDSIFETIIDFSVQNEKMKIPNFGSFHVKHKKSRPGRDINVNKNVTIAARKVVSFCPSTQLKQAINDKKQS